jgi:molybdate transport system substrate-binding protein
MQLDLLSGGAAQGLVQALAPEFKAQTGCDIAAQFGAVGAMRDKLLVGAPADLLILTAALIGTLGRDGHVDPASARDLGPVRTAIAIRDGDPQPRVESPGSLRVALMEADAIYFPDPELATAGIHFVKVLAALGIDGMVAARLRPHPNGAAAMRALAAAPEPHPIGCTQGTEILHTPGVSLVSPLPAEFELATVYTVAVCRKAASADLAQRFAAMLTGDAAAKHRREAGFGV